MVKILECQKVRMPNKKIVRQLNSQTLNRHSVKQSYGQILKLFKRQSVKQSNWQTVRLAENQPVVQLNIEIIRPLNMKAVKQ